MLYLVIPTRNEAPYIQGAIQSLARSLGGLKPGWQMIVADNGSTDGTGDAVEQLRIKNDELRDKVRLLNCPEEGKGVAIVYSAKQLRIKSDESSLEQATRDDNYFGFIDADLSADPDAIRGMLDKLLADEADIVIGSRLLNTKTTNRGWLRTFTSKLFNLGADLFLGIKVKDAQCGLKLMNARGAEILKQCQETGWFLDIEFLARARQQGLRILEAPVVWTEFRFPGRKSQIRHMQDGLEAVRAMRRVRRKLHN